MNDILNPAAAQTMSSREIAELTGKQHKNVIRDLEKMLSDIGEDRLKFEHIYQDAYGRDQKEYALPKNLTLNLIAGYRADLRLKIIDRWMELEATPAPTPALDLQDPDTLRGLLIDYATRTIEMKKENAALTEENAALLPKAQAHDLLAEQDGELGVRDAGRELKVGQQWVTTYIDRHGWSCVEGGKRKPAHYGLKHGYCRLIPEDYRHPHTGEEKVREAFRLTRKGIARLAEIIAKLKKENAPVPFARTPEPVS